MSTIIGKKYEIISELGEGTFGKVFKCKHIHSGDEFAIKIQHKDIANVLKQEAKIYKHLQDVSGIPMIRNYGTDNGFNYLVIDMLSSSLDDLILNPKEIIKYKIQALTIIEDIHEKGILHRDIKPDNFLLKEKEGTKYLYLIDFGLSKYYWGNDKKHMEERNERKLIGTAKYSSLNVHNGIEASRRDDIESLCYAFISLYSKEFPWAEVIEKHYSVTKDERPPLQELYDGIREKKEGIHWLIDMPGELITMLLYSRKLEFAEKPNYNYLRGIFENFSRKLHMDVCKDTISNNLEH